MLCDNCLTVGSFDRQRFFDIDVFAVIQSRKADRRVGLGDGQIQHHIDGIVLQQLRNAQYFWDAELSGRLFGRGAVDIRAGGNLREWGNCGWSSDIFR